jgi:Fe-S oxidoreductase
MSSSSPEQEECTKNFCSNYVKKAYNKVKEGIHMFKTKKGKKMGLMKNKTFKNVFTKMKKLNMKKMNEALRKGCEISFCNPGCKNTIFQDGKQFPKDLNLNLFKKNKGVMELMKKTRKHIFKGESSVLKDGFYKDIRFRGDIKTVNELKKRGAISGCNMTVVA